MSDSDEDNIPDQMDVTRDGADEGDKTKVSKTQQIKALQALISDKKERIKKILAKPATNRNHEELIEVASLLSVSTPYSYLPLPCPLRILSILMGV